MLARGAFDADYVAACRTRWDQLLSDFERVADDAPGLSAGLVLALEALFVHRQRGKEAKDGAMKDLRARAEALAADPAAAGPTRDELRQLGDGVFAEVEARFV
ncbi:MAG TPA: hypothetical protein VIL49_12540 [Capillimicrobium sp.]|jgi:hypothetical protein